MFGAPVASQTAAVSREALCRRKAEAAAQPRTETRERLEKLRKVPENLATTGALKIRIFEIMPLGPPKGADTPPRGGGGGPQNSIFEIMTAWTPQRSQTPLHEERGGGPQNSICSESSTHGPSKRAGEAPGRSRHAMASRGRVQPRNMKQRL